MSISSVNPHSGEVTQTYEALSPPALQEKLAKAEAAAVKNRRRSFAERAQKMAALGAVLEREKESLARTATLEMGKTLVSARAEVEKCAWVCRFYAEHAERFLADEQVAVEGGEAHVRYQPLGTVLAVMPWNFPYWQVFRFVAPALMAGNVGVLKHASNVPGCALAIERVVRQSGFDHHELQTLLIGSEPVAGVIADVRVKAVTLTGSEPAGRQVGAEAGRHLKKVVLELGGSDPFIVLPSADVEKAADTAVKARTLNNGQSCIAAKRFIVHQAVYEKFLARFVEKMKGLKVGNPLEVSTDVGPLATKKIREELDAQVRRSVEAGAKVLTGGQVLPGPGWYYSPTVLADLPPHAPAYAEELFGPVASVFRVEDAEEALALANATPFGLGSSVWTKDAGEEALFVDGLEAGSVFVNAMVASDPRLPFGGIKQSGIGRELGVHGIREFVNVKTVRKA